MTPLDIATVAGNIITAALLAAGGIAALSIARARSDAAALPPKIALVFGAGLLALAVDEALDLHERAGSWLYDRGVEAPGPVNHVDDLILIGYVVVGAISLAVALPALIRVPRLLLAILAAGGLFAAAAALDALATPGGWTEAPEEALEACGAALLAFAFIRERTSARLSSTNAPRAGLPSPLAERGRG